MIYCGYAAQHKRSFPARGLVHNTKLGLAELSILFLRSEIYSEQINGTANRTTMN
jgi:hypothetical protein